MTFGLKTGGLSPATTQEERMMMSKKWYEVTLIMPKTVRVFAEDEEEARAKAEHKLNKNNTRWMADTVTEEN